MESLGRLQDTLPGSEAAEKELQASFRSAALALTSLFKQGKNAANKAYIAGKREALQDVLEFLQTSLDHPAPGNAAGPLNVARLIDYICARQETLAAEEEGDDEDDVGASAGHHNTAGNAASTSSRAPTSTVSATSRPTGRASSMFAHRHPSPPPHSATQLQSQPRASTSSAASGIPATSSSAPSSPAFNRVSSAPEAAREYRDHRTSNVNAYGSDDSLATRAARARYAWNLPDQPPSAGRGTPVGSGGSAAPSGVDAGSNTSTPTAGASVGTTTTNTSTSRSRRDRDRERERATASNASTSSTSLRKGKGRGGSGLGSGSGSGSASMMTTTMPSTATTTTGSGGGPRSRSAAAAAATAVDAMVDSAVVGDKRRWANVAMAEVNLGLAGLTSDNTCHPAAGGGGGVAGDADVDAEAGDASADGCGAGGGGSGVQTGDDSMEMEMDGWNGLGERPSKRLTRMSLR